ncbi:hypothetical protein A2U01_0037718, partial [Trifolium medium]|nr:hypothetical protein [Trifolium medium]
CRRTHSFLPASITDLFLPLRRLNALIHLLTLQRQFGLRQWRSGGGGGCGGDGGGGAVLGEDGGGGVVLSEE